MGAGRILSQLFFAATTSTLFSMPWSIRSRNCLEVLNCAAVGGVPPTMRLTAAERACSPPAIAASTQVPPALVYAADSSLTAADSPPDVHQCSTSARLACACAPAVEANAQASARARRVVLLLMSCLLALSLLGQLPARRASRNRLNASAESLGVRTCVA